MILQAGQTAGTLKGKMAAAAVAEEGLPMVDPAGQGEGQGNIPAMVQPMFLA